jgi:hypothetical protein
VELDGNALAYAPGYKHAIVNHLPALQRLDGEMVMDKDHQNAQHFVAYHHRRHQVCPRNLHSVISV